ncbi:uncharacterized protein LOC143225771 isoform X2 [Tachypleus tridentatus]|uniref:uncharacterized protein LOC143225771 isoform X2 n=1 Tax=Tachypleus tridentatus TaxID=6853 RepID=UPI003FD413A3
MKVYTVHKSRVMALILALVLGCLIVCMLSVQNEQTGYLRSVTYFRHQTAGNHKGTTRKLRDFLGFFLRSEGSDVDDGSYRISRQNKNTNYFRKTQRDTQSLDEEEDDFEEYGEEDIIDEDDDTNEEYEEDYYDEDGNPPNPVFKQGDFDYSNITFFHSLSHTPYDTVTVNVSDVVSVTNISDLPKHFTLTSEVVRVSTNVNQKLAHVALLTTTSSAYNNTLNVSETPKFCVPFQVSLKVNNMRNTTLKNNDGIPLVDSAIYWSQEVENIEPKGISDAEVDKYIRQLRHLSVIRADPSTWDRCGRPKNLYITLTDGSHVCARYRAPHDYLVQGELMSFYLARLLGIHNVPVVTLSAPDVSGQWREPHVTKAVVKAGWAGNATVALIQWIDNLERDRMPKVILEALLTNKTINSRSSRLKDVHLVNAVELLQWSDLIMFDYLTGNYDSKYAGCCRQRK